MPYVLDPAPVRSLPVTGSDDRFPVGRIFCVGRNYADHAREMGSDPDREPPVFFLKPTSALVEDGATLAYPPATHDLQHEVELVVALGRGGAGIPVGAALEHVWGYGVGLDMTRRDLQLAAKKAGGPWDLAKGFDDAAPCSALAPAATIGHPTRGAIVLTVNGRVAQSADLATMIWSVAETIAHLSGLITLAPGDLIFTGTPAGVGPVQRGDRLEGRIEGVGRLGVTIG